MKNKGFTLIELLAVIIILAIIALIATPIILNIIDDAKEESNERSIDNYAKAVENAIAKHQLREGTPMIGTFTYADGGRTLNLDSETGKFLTVEYDGSSVECETIKVKKDGTFYLNECKVDGVLVEDYTYGTPVACTLNDKDISGGATLSDEVTCGTESFYVMSTDDMNNTVTMLSMFNLNVGDNSYSEGALGIQNENVQGYQSIPTYGNIAFSTSAYWKDGDYSPAGDSEYPYVYDINSNLYQYVNEYERILKEELKVNSAIATLISYEQVMDLKTNLGNPSWIHSTSYWTGSAKNGVYNYSDVWRMYSTSTFSTAAYHYSAAFGVRPVITVSIDDIG